MPKLRSSPRGRTVANGSFVPREIDSQYYSDGPRPSIREALSLVDTTDPAWPFVAAVLREFATSGVEIDATSVATALKVGKRRMYEAPHLVSAVQPTLVSSADSIVYYIRRGDFIKIGTTTSPRGRFVDLHPDEILAFEPGDRRQEKQRHRQFWHLRQSGEYFHPEPDLMDHIRTIRSLYGDPDPAWRDLNRPRGRRSLPPPPLTSMETLTVAEAGEELGINRNTLYGWVRRKLIDAVGRDHAGRHTYYREHLVHLRDNARKVRTPRL